MNIKYVAAAAVVAMLIIAPFGSFFYLKSGLKYRLESMAQLEPKIIDESKQEVVKQVLQPQMAALLHLGGDTDAKGIDLLKQVDDRIVDRDNFEIFTNASKSNFKATAQIQYIDSELVESLKENQFMLFDTSATLRYVYDYGPDHAKLMIRHLAVVIPVPKSREIKLKRELE